MYELINTSVPNGLLPGTHGFATVAMTKGMPDAIRARVENLCAYPHRTSAHDESYFKENPVNWFHLTLPGGDHVVGRTVPADFDYTGRTNRISRIITFKPGEMPSAGGTAVLRTASAWLSEAWSGEPRMLSADKALSARIFATGRGGSCSPSNWVALLGEHGESLARRLAILVAKNVLSGRSVYFKTGTSWDASGTKLLGLFSDIIELLPDEIAPLVTFSTFAVCVPGGVVCHLRGVYDKDGTFEVASATQPWVDCEHGRIVHEELLPDETVVDPVSIPDVAENAIGRSFVAASSSVSGQGLSLPPQNKYDAIYRPHDGGDKMLYIGLCILAAIVLIGVLGLYLWINRSSTASSSSGDLLLQEAKEYRAEAERAEIEAGKTEDLAAELALKEREAEEKQAKKERAEAEKKKKDEDEKEAKKVSEEAKRKQEEDEKIKKDEIEKAIKSNLEVSFDRLKITKVIDEKQAAGLKEFEVVEKKKNTDGLLAAHSVVITNENSVVIYYADGGKIEMAKCRYATKHIKPIGNSPARTKYTIAGWPDKAKDSPWVVFRVVNPEFGKEGQERSFEVFWWWNELAPQTMWFENADKVDLKKECFVCDEAYTLYSGFRKVFYKIVWTDENGILAFNTISPRLSIEKFKPAQADVDSRTETLKQNKFRIEEEKKEIRDKIRNAEKIKRDVEQYAEELIALHKAKESEKNKEEKNKKKNDFESRKKAINAEIVPRLAELGIHGQELSEIEMAKNRILDKIDGMIKNLKSKEDEKDNDISKTDNNIDDIKNEAKKWKESVRSRMFSVTGVEAVGAHGDGIVYNAKQR